MFSEHNVFVEIIRFEMAIVHMGMGIRGGATYAPCPHLIPVPKALFFSKHDGLTNTHIRSRNTTLYEHDSLSNGIVLKIQTVSKCLCFGVTMFMFLGHNVLTSNQCFRWNNY